MLATAQLIQQAALPYRLDALLPRWLREVPLYQQSAHLPLSAGEAFPLSELRRLPLITKQDIRRDFPRNFLRPGVDLESLVEQDAIELEHTSGTSEARTP